jgi:eukaryotic-like serine/threonine-protein kinase
MTTQRWREIERIFEAVSESPVEERQVHLDRECAGDEELRREVNTLLACDGEDEGFAEKAVQAAAASLARETATKFIGRLIGPYRVTRAIGRGGMGVVYEAIREGEDYEQRVAIKLLRGGMETDADVRRFRRERQLLARLDHPSIARLLDGGATDGGLPYIVMDYVEGRPITDYCRDKGLPLEQKLRLFLQLCGAVQYAHQRLIVHRDIKPGNVLVTPDGTPKLLDFGIAQLSDQETDLSTYTTARLLTPAYASPEQLRNEAVTTASDVYSLGALLYELVAGQPTHPRGTLSAKSLASVVCQTDPAPPSVVAHRRELRGDLDNIVLMALRKEPNRRYASAEQFAADIRRYLEGRPVLARKDTVRYRAGKFLKRNHTGAAAVILVAASLIGGMIAANYQARRAERRFNDVRKLAHAMLFDVNDKLKGIPATLEARMLLVDTATRYYDSLAKDSARDEALQWELAQSYSQLARLQAGHLAGPLGGELLPGLGDSAGALASLRKALSIQEQLAQRYRKPEYQQPLPVLYYNIGMLQTDSLRAIPYMRKGLELARNLRGSGKQVNGPTSMLLYGLALAQFKAGDPKVALATARTPPFRVETIGLQPFALAALGDLEPAAAGLQRGAAGCEEELRKPHRQMDRRIIIHAEALQMTGLANVLGNPYVPNLERTAGAETAITRAIALFEDVSRLDPNDRSHAPDVTRAYRAKAAIVQDTNPDEAVVLCRKAMTVDPGAHAQIAHPLRKLGRTQEALHELAAAIAAPLREEDAILARIEMGELRLQQGDRQSATDAWRQALEIAGKAVAQKPYMMRFHKDLADCYELLGMWDKSLAIWKDWSRWGVSSSYDQNRKHRAEKMLSR